MEKELPLLTSLFPNLNLTEISEKHTDNHLHINLTKNNKNCKGNNLANLPTNALNNKNFTHINNDKLYNCHDNTQEKRVRSVVRISRRSSEPQAMGSKPTGPVINMGSNISESYIIIGERGHSCPLN